jgi:flagella basal body P-ring formation protein FlgA
MITARPLRTRAALLALSLAVAAPAGVRAEEAVEAQAERLVASALPPALAVVEVALPATVKSRSGQLSIAWLAPPRRGTQSVQLILPSGQRAFARVRLAERRPVLVAHRALATGEHLAAGDVLIELRAIEGAVAVAPDPAALVGAEVRRDVAAGAIVADEALLRPPPVAAGTQVRVRAERGGVVVAVNGRLDRPARPGDAASARLYPDMRLVRGRLVDGATFVVGETP